MLRDWYSSAEIRSRCHDRRSPKAHARVALLARPAVSLFFLENRQRISANEY